MLVSFPGFGARRVAPASNNSAASPWWGWQWDNVAGNNYDNDDNDDNAYGTKNGVNAPFHCQPPPQ
eukprot:11154588-Ditylum_brightwellii.AAC.1